MPTIITRADAAANGKKRYFTGVPCKKGHVAERYVKNTACVGCLNYTILSDNDVILQFPLVCRVWRDTTDDQLAHWAKTMLQWSDHYWKEQGRELPMPKADKIAAAAAANLEWLKQTDPQRHAQYQQDKTPRIADVHGTNYRLVAGRRYNDRPLYNRMTVETWADPPPPNNDMIYNEAIRHLPVVQVDNIWYGITDDDQLLPFFVKDVTDRERMRR